MNRNELPPLKRPVDGFHRDKDGDLWYFENGRGQALDLDEVEVGHPWDWSIAWVWGPFRPVTPRR